MGFVGQNVYKKNEKQMKCCESNMKEANKKGKRLVEKEVNYGQIPQTKEKHD